MKILTKGRTAWDIIARVLLYLWCAFSIFVFLWVINSSLKTNQGFFSDIWGIAHSPQYGNYRKIWTTYHLGTYFINSLLIVIPSVLGLLAVSAPAAYVLARKEFPFRKQITNLVSFGMGIPYQLLLVPLFFLLFNLRLINSKFGLIMVYIALSIPFTVFLLLGYFRTLPKSLEEAAEIDGCGPMLTFFRIMLPLTRNGLVAAAVLNFVGLWNEFLLALTFISKDSNYTLSMGLYALQGSLQYTGDWVSLFAAFTLVVIPTFLLFILLSRTIVAGMTMGAVKE
ncbi:carbohydrate ABC transporter permease [Sediminispirochaeta bajacaliforniensis]|uniref:carbohydrate ABC transporter permease n=1 Tax=Sediminispirochaeta bajacaliforniensis TaxID=148 RepID=UPI0003821063|nr:carbohydrate ABC transporter permease [Sediminispirochaeta bajacaliforniensis]